VVIPVIQFFSFFFFVVLWFDLIKIPMTFITEIEKSSLKFIWKHKKPRIAKAILSEKSNAGHITIPDFKLYYRAIATNVKNNETEDPDVNPCSCTHLIFVKGSQNIHWKKPACEH
jgi:hypothetical protein